MDNTLTNSALLGAKPPPAPETEPVTPKAETGQPAENNLSDNPFVFVPESRAFARVELVYPLEDSEGNEEATELEMRRPTVDDSLIAEKLAEGDSTGLFVARLANLCEVSPQAMETLDELEDMENLMEAYGLLKHYDGKAEGNPHIVMADNRKSVAIRLRHPVKAGVDADGQDKLLDELVMRRPRLKDSTEAEKKSKWPTEVMAYKYAALCGVSLDVIRQLDDVDDFTSLDQAFGLFRRSKINRRKKR